MCAFLGHVSEQFELFFTHTVSKETIATVNSNKPVFAMRV